MIEVRHLQKSFGTQRVLDGVDMSRAASKADLAAE